MTRWEILSPYLLLSPRQQCLYWRMRSSLCAGIHWVTFLMGVQPYRS